MILTDEEIRAIDTSEYWFEHTPHEFAREIESAVLAKLADKLRDAEMLEWLLQRAHVAERFSQFGRVLEIAGTDRRVPCPDNWGEAHYSVRDAIAAAMLASRAVKP
jgi:hypothetical protein